MIKKIFLEIAQNWKQHKCSSSLERVNKSLVYSCNGIIYSKGDKNYSCKYQLGNTQELDVKGKEQIFTQYHTSIWIDEYP